MGGTWPSASRAGEGIVCLCGIWRCSDGRSNWGQRGGAPARKGTSTWVKVTLGCGLALILGTATCVGGCLYIGKRARKDPEGFKRSLLSYVKQFIREDWEDLRRLVTQLGSDAGAQELYRSAPGSRSASPPRRTSSRRPAAGAPSSSPSGGHPRSRGPRHLLQHPVRRTGGAQLPPEERRPGAHHWDGKRRKDLSRASQLVDLDVQP